MSIRKEAMYELLEKLGGEDVSSHMVLMELIQWLDADTIVEFVDDFSRLNGVMGDEEHDLCAECGKSYDMNDDHTCDSDNRDRVSGRSAHMREENCD